MGKQNKKRNRRVALQEHPLVSAVLGDSISPPRMRVIRGYVGKSTESGKTRVYLDIELHRFVDILSDEITHFERSSRENDFLAPDLVWIEENTKIQHHGFWFATEDPTTMAGGEEGDPDPTTMATGEESTSFQDPLELIVNPNPFGRY